MVMQSMPGKSEGPHKDEIGERVLNIGVMLSHHRHVQAGRRTSPRCGFCSKGLEGVSSLPEIQAKQQDNSVDESGRDHPEGTAPPAPTGRWYWEADELL